MIKYINKKIHEVKIKEAEYISRYESFNRIFLTEKSSIIAFMSRMVVSTHGPFHFRFPCSYFTTERTTGRSAEAIKRLKYRRAEPRTRQFR